MLAPRFEWNQFLVHGVNMILLMMELVVDDVAFVPAQIVLVLAFDLLYFVLVLVPFQVSFITCSCYMFESLVRLPPGW